MKSPDELWMPIPTFNGYEASNLGHIRNAITGRVLKPYNGYGRDGRYYKKVSIYRHGEKYCQFVHRLVAFSFFEIDHINRVRDNNHLTNLEPVLRSENDRRWRETEEVPF